MNQARLKAADQPVARPVDRPSRKVAVSHLRAADEAPGPDGPDGKGSALKEATRRPPDSRGGAYLGQVSTNGDLWTASTRERGIAL